MTFLFRRKKADAAKLTGPSVTVKNVERTFGQGDTAVRVLRGVDLDVHSGQLIALYGPSGSGKTTLLNLIGALDTPTAGTIMIGDKDISRMSDGARAKLRRTQIGFIFQSYALIPTYTAFENIDLALRLPKLGARQRRQRATAALEAVGLNAWASHVPDELSGGQRQRVAIARALALRPRLILADEPTSALDTRTARRVLALFRGIAASQGTTFIIVSHDPMVAEHVDVAYDLQDGRLMPHSTAALENLAHAQHVADEHTAAAVAAAALTTEPTTEQAQATNQVNPTNPSNQPELTPTQAHSAQPEKPKDTQSEPTQEGEPAN